ncbi:MAG: thioesterase family protein [Pseudomonadota bacterium]
MSGILRNLFSILRALFRYASADSGARLTSGFWISPLDTGIFTLKSDKYFQLAEAAQLDFLIRTGLITTLLRQGYGFVNASQLVKFMQPIRLFSRVRVETEIIFADDKCAYFSHAFYVGPARQAEVLVKMKFKKAGRTIAPQQLLGANGKVKTAQLQRWDEALEALANPGS